MFSKSWLSITIFLTMALTLSGCDQFLKGRSSEEEKRATTVDISTDKINCLKMIPNEMQKYFDDEAGPKSIPDTISCLQSSLKTFMRLTKGSKPDVYMSHELKYFFNTFLLKEHKISDELQKEIMNLKVMAVGGSEEVATRFELEQFITFLGDLQPQLMQLQGQMRLALFREEKGIVSNAHLIALKEDLSSLSQFILTRTKLTSSKYEWSYLMNFLNLLNQFVGESKGLTHLLKWMPLATKVKYVFIGEKAKFVSESDWRTAEKWLINSYVSGLRFYYQVKDQPYTTTEEWNDLVSWLDEVMEVIEFSPAMIDRKMLNITPLEELIDELFNLKLIKTTLTPKLLKETFRKAIVHFIEATGSRDESNVSGFTDAHLKIVKREYVVWKLSQKFLNDTYAQRTTLSLVNLRNYADQYEIRDRFEITDDQINEINQSWVDFKNLLKSQPGLTFSPTLKIQIQHRNEEEPITFAAANMFNTVRTMTRLLMRGYGDRQTKNLFDKTITRERLIHLEEDFREFGRAVGFLDKRETGAASRTFDQGNFFAYHGNGDEALTAVESAEILSLLLSGGRGQLKEFYAELEKRSCLLDELDIFNRNYVREDCFYQSLREQLHLYTSHVPGMRRFLSGLSDKQFAEVYKGLMAVAYVKSHKPGKLESAEIRSFGVVLNFIESLMAVYDQDNNMLLSESEILAAVPRFNRFIIKASPLGDFLVEDIFLYLAFTGEKPEPKKDWAKMTAFLAKRHTVGLGETDKFKLIKVLSVLHNESKK